MSYVDGCVIAVPTDQRAAFIEHANAIDPVLLELGALRVMECWGTDVPDGTVTDFKRAVQATDEESVAFSWVEWPDKATRDAAMDRMQNDPDIQKRMMGEGRQMPFDGARLIYGGFEPIVELKA